MAILLRDRPAPGDGFAYRRRGYAKSASRVRHALSQFSDRPVTQQAARFQQDPGFAGRPYLFDFHARQLGNISDQAVKIDPGGFEVRAGKDLSGTGLICACFGPDAHGAYGGG